MEVKEDEVTGWVEDDGVDEAEVDGEGEVETTNEKAETAEEEDEGLNEVAFYIV